MINTSQRLEILSHQVIVSEGYWIGSPSLFAEISIFIYLISTEKYDSNGWFELLYCSSEIKE